MEERSFFTFCISACIFMIFINLSLIFIASLGVFPFHGNTELPGGTQNPSDVVGNITGQPSNFLSLFTGGIGGVITILTTLGFVTVLGFSLYSGNWNMLAVYIFTVVFWGSWTYSLTIFNSGGLFNFVSVSLLITILSVGMFFLFIGSVTGLLQGGE